MKKLIILMCAAIMGAGAAARRVAVTTPGTLAQIVGDAKYSLTSLTVEGTLNASDIRVLREMMGSDFNLKPTQGKLRSLNLKKVTFLPGKDAYANKDGEQTVTSAHTLPAYIFSNTRIERLVLPEHTDTIGRGAFENAALSCVSLSDSVTVMPYSFSAMPELVEIKFPKFAKEISYLAIVKCPKLKTLKFGNIGYMSANCIQDNPSVETITFGAVGHIDGWYTMARMPKLRSVTFSGEVLSTGGPKLFDECPALGDVNFLKPVYKNYLGDGDNCAKMRYVSHDWVFGCGDTESKTRLTATPQATIYSNPDKCLKLLEKFQEMTKWHRYTANRMRTPLLSPMMKVLKKDYAAAGRELKAAVDNGIYMGFDQIKADSTYYTFWLPAAEKDDNIAQAIARLKNEGSYLWVLQQAGPYAKGPETQPAFTYQMANDSNLMRIRQYFNLDSIAGNGDEISKIKNLMYWIHDLIRHDGSNGFPQNTKRDLIDLYNACKAQKRGLNCRGLAMVLNQCYLAMGIPARFLTCESRLYKQDGDCHVINMVWSRQLKKWIWMDPSFAAYVTDENGLLLHPGEVRERLISNRPLILNADANWNHENLQTKEDYLENYMAKNLYLLSAHSINSYNTEVGKDPGDKYIYLAPTGFESISTFPGYTNDDAYFWQAPE